MKPGAVADFAAGGRDRPGVENLAVHIADSGNRNG